MKIANSLRVVASAPAALALTLLIGACAALQPTRVENPNLHLLEARAVTRVTPEKRNLVVEVGTPRAWPGFDTPQMAYVQKPYELDYFANNRWADSPAQMIGPLLARALEQTGSFRAVVQPPTVVPADLRVNSELIRLQQNFAARPSRVELSLRIQLVDVHGKRVVATRTFEETENAPSDDAYGGVTAANAALQRLLGQAVDFCIAESGNRPRSTVSAP
jgi:cholesterol transport system auxiliary component